MESVPVFSCFRKERRMWVTTLAATKRVITYVYIYGMCRPPTARATKTMTKKMVRGICEYKVYNISFRCFTCFAETRFKDKCSQTQMLRLAVEH